MSRQDDISDIKMLFDIDTPEGEKLLVETVQERGLAALTDEAVAALAEAHRLRDGLGG